MGNWNAGSATDEQSSWPRAHQRDSIVTERVVELDLEFRPEAAISGGLLIQSESSVSLLFNTMSARPGRSGYLEDMGIGILEFNSCVTTRFGYPNDEGRNEHPLFDKGLSEIGYGVCEVLNSRWAAEWMAMTRASAERIWGLGQTPRPARMSGRADTSSSPSMTVRLSVLLMASRRPSTAAPGTARSKVCSKEPSRNEEHRRA